MVKYMEGPVHLSFCIDRFIFKKAIDLLQIGYKYEVYGGRFW